MELTDTHISWLQRNKAMSGSSASASPPPAPVTGSPLADTSADQAGAVPTTDQDALPSSAPAAFAAPPASAPPDQSVDPNPSQSVPVNAHTDDAGQPLPATDTVMFFQKDSADLTSDDQAALDRYAANYAAAGLTDPVKVEGWASVEGDANHNRTLAGQRAKAVADYLASKGIAKVSGHGNGPTPQFGKDLASNRRAMLSPVPPVAPTPPTTPGPTGPAQPPVDIDPRSPANQKAIQDTIDNAKEADDWVRKRLTSSGLRPDPVNSSGDSVQYNNKTTPLDDVVKDAVDNGKNAPIKAPELIAEERVRRIAAEVLIAATPGGGKLGGKSLLNIKFQIQYQFIPKTLHTPGTPDQPAQQLAFDVVLALHAEDESGLEITGQAQATAFADAKGQSIKVQSANGALQVAWVQNFLGGNLQISLAPLQVSFGGSRAPIDGQSRPLEWAPTGQISASGQALFTIGKKGNFIHDHVMIGWQAAVSRTMPKGAPDTTDRNVGFVVQFQF
jgi:outer membrane protein OmpA-like peptidoglycan-associated protein